MCVEVVRVGTRTHLQTERSLRIGTPSSWIMREQCHRFFWSRGGKRVQSELAVLRLGLLLSCNHNNLDVAGRVARGSFVRCGGLPCALQGGASWVSQEFVHSDEGRTQPHLASLLGLSQPAEILALDVLQIHMDFL